MNIKSRKYENINKGLLAALERKDQVLRNYAHMTSHDLRAPIASILGLMQLWELHQHDDEFSQTLMSKLQECARQLDQVALRLNAELDPDILNQEKETDRY